jgi:hypothetical protein
MNPLEAPLNNPRDVAFFLASYARDARARVEHAGDLPALTAVRAALVLLTPALDANYAAAKACATPLPGQGAP